MTGRIASSLQQIAFLKADIDRMVNRRWWRWLTVWVSPASRSVVAYRLSRSLYLLLGPAAHAALRLLLSPVLVLVQPWFGACDIHHRAAIGPGLLILHPSLGLVVSMYVVSGRDLTLTGGNCLGMRGRGRTDITLGDSVTLGANAVVLGPVVLGHRVQIGAGAVVTRDAPDDAVLAGVPARPLGVTDRGDLDAARTPSG